MSGKEIARHAKDFTARLRDWTAAPGQDAAWNERLRMTAYIGESIHLQPGAQSDHHVFEFERRPVGLMSVERPDLQFDDALCVEFLVTHPGTSGVGSALIEKAVNESVRLGTAGRLRLSADGGALPFYRALGFEGEADALTLDPAKPEMAGLWAHDGTRWHLARFPKGELFGSVAEMAAQAQAQARAQATEQAAGEASSSGPGAAPPEAR